LETSLQVATLAQLIKQQTNSLVNGNVSRHVTIQPKEEDNHDQA